MTAELLRRARSGDRDAFVELVEPHRAELLVHCYRMLGSLQDAEDALQDALLSAWVALAGFEGRSSVRTWLYRICTNGCLNLLRTSARRPPETTSVLWLQPFPDSMLDETPSPEAVIESREAISLAFITAVQLLPPNQRAVLLLRDVLGYRAAEAADLLGLSPDAVASALKRARATMTQSHGQPPPPAPDSPAERALAERFVHAFTQENVEALIALLTDDAWVRMPPLPFEYRGREEAHRFFTGIEDQRRSVARMVPTRANGHPAWGEYFPDPSSDALHLSGMLVVAFAGDKIREITHFETTVTPYFGLPRTLKPAR